MQGRGYDGKIIFEGNVEIVSGAGRSIGRAIAERMGMRGPDLVICAIKKETANAEAKEIIASSAFLEHVRYRCHSFQPPFIVAGFGLICNIPPGGRIIAATL